MSQLSMPCSSLSGVGPALSAKLERCGVFTVQDLLFYLPYRYQDRTRVTAVQDLRANDWCVVSGRICRTEIKFGRRRTLVCYLEDKTGVLTLRFFHFNQTQIKVFQTEPVVRVFGEVREFADRAEMVHPEYQVLNEHGECTVEETLTPIYPLTHGLTQTRLRQLVKQALKISQNELADLEWMTEPDLQELGFQPLHHSIRELHHPPPDISLQLLEDGGHPALKRLAFDELLAQRVSIHFARQQRAELTSPALCAPQDLNAQFLKRLPFNLTGAQQRVHEEIKADLMQQKPMLRLVQGDVGSGKTVIAALAALQAIGSGYQVALMAPTDILSEQHAQTLTPWMEPLGINVLRLSGKMKAKERRETLNALASGECQLIVGTHALFQDGVTFKRLGLVIIDEQHRFGVEQRLLLHQKGQQDQTVPHQLLMTATPIPRTLAMTQFAHLDLSTVDELPPGRSPIITAVIHQGKRQEIIERLQQAVAEGRQAYWVCTLIEESEKQQCMAAVDCAQGLALVLPGVRVGLVHGRMKAAEKESTMAAFKQGNLDLLVATTVIEVGVDVPNASLMIIENAERLGLSQLHQLRGRTGRGPAQSHCLLLYQPPLSWHSSERLKIMRATCNGFEIAEKDLQLRGRGDLLGSRQTGYHTYKIANLPRDAALLTPVSQTAKSLHKNNPETAHKIAKRWLGNFEAFFQG